LEERLREPHRDRRSLAGCALDLEATATDLRTFTHHRHAEVTLGAGGFRVEADPVVLQAQHDVVVLLTYCYPHISRLGVFQSVHDSFASDVIHEQRDGSGELYVRHVAMEADGGIAADLLGEGFERLRKSLRPQRGSVQISDECPDAVRRLLLRMTDLVELRSDVFRLPLLQELTRDINLDGESEQHLREVIVKVSGDLQSLVGSFLGHGIRERSKDLLAGLKFLVGFFESLRSEEHLASQEQRRHEGG